MNLLTSRWPANLGKRGQGFLHGGKEFDFTRTFALWAAQFHFTQSSEIELQCQGEND